jgi:hypothetical protein
MGCCGQGRAALRAQTASARAHPAPQELPRTRATAVIRYAGSGRVRVRGAASGRVYEFARGEKAEVAAADIPTMVRTGLFARD